jgi:hypothetical protein
MATNNLNFQPKTRFFGLLCWILGTFLFMFIIGFIGYIAGWGERSLTFSSKNVSGVFSQALFNSAILMIATLFFLMYTHLFIWIFRSFRSAKVLGYSVLAIFYLFFVLWMTSSIAAPAQTDSYGGLAFSIYILYMLFVIPIAIFIGWILGLFIKRLR